MDYLQSPRRWWLLVTVVLLNLANYSHWVAFPAVNKVVAGYYNQTDDAMDLIPTLAYGLGFPSCILATYVVDRFGLRASIYVGACGTGLGKIN